MTIPTRDSRDARSGARPSGARGRWKLRDRPGVFWLALAVLTTLVHRFVPDARWLMVHMVVLGAATHSIMVWSLHFAEALLKPGPSGVEPRERTNARLGLLLGGVSLVLIGMPLGWPWLMTLGAVGVTAAVGWHAVVLLTMLRRSLPARFAVAVHHYIAAAALLVVGIVFGVLLAFSPTARWEGRLLVAHTMTNLLGWIGLSVLGTFITLWPTVLRTRMAPSAARVARVALPTLIAAVLIVDAGALLGLRGLSVAGLVVYLAGVLATGHGVLDALRRKTPDTFAGWSMLAGFCWLIAALVMVIVRLVSHDWAALAAQHGLVTSAFVVGFVSQTLFGALSWLVPSVLGGGPAIVRATLARVNTGTALRIVVTNAGLLVCLLPVPSLARVIVSIFVLAALVTFLPLLMSAIKVAVRLRRAAARGNASEATRPDRPAFSTMQALAGLLVVALGVTAGVVADPAAAGIRQAGPAVVATGETTTVRVEAHGMAFTPDRIEVPAGNRLVIQLANTDPSNVHDLVLATGATSGRLSPGESATVDVGVVGADIDGWCSVVGHRQMGMTLTVVALGATSAPSASTQPSTQTQPATDLSGDPGPDFRAFDPVLRPSTGTTHKLTLTVREQEAEVAAGVRQLRWIYDGGPAGLSPVLHGKVGDRFEITLVNAGTMGHSIDFHAGALAPDKPMRTIPPGERLTYTFTATRAGAWMYHCSTVPMSTHIAAGMAGAVIIEPDGLPAVDRSYVLVQSELYLGGQGEPVNADKVATGLPDGVVFNGYAFQYDHAPLQAKVGERVRFWVVDTGPNRPISFHIVGGQFDTVYKEGGYLLKRGRDAFGGRGGGSQVLDLAPAQGGFVELTFPEAGHYPVVNHVMSDAERGAHGVVEVTR